MRVYWDHWGPTFRQVSLETFIPLSFSILRMRGGRWLIDLAVGFSWTGGISCEASWGTRK